MTNCPICQTNESDSNCEIVLNWEQREKRGPFYTCTYCWDDLQSVLNADASLPFEGNNLKISLKDESEEGKLAIFDSVPTQCIKCKSTNLYLMEGTKLNGVERKNRTCRDCGAIMFLREGLS